jgi:hypothetical protein
LLATEDLLYWLENDLALPDCAIGCLLLQELAGAAR